MYQLSLIKVLAVRIKKTWVLSYPLRFCQNPWFDSGYILSETSKPPLDILSYTFAYIIHTWLQFTHNKEKSITQNLSKFHSQKFNLTCSIHRLYKGTIALHSHTSVRILTHRSKTEYSRNLKWKNPDFMVLWMNIIEHFWVSLLLSSNFRPSTMFLWKLIWYKAT